MKPVQPAFRSAAKLLPSMVQAMEIQRSMRRSPRLNPGLPVTILPHALQRRQYADYGSLFAHVARLS
jgi:hypothetical protein